MLRASELKYRVLARKPANRERLLNLQRDVLAQHKCVTCICDKRFLLVLMFMDYAAVEPFYYERGINFYEDGQNYALASLCYRVGPTLLGKEGFNALLAAFQRAIKDKTPEAFDELVFAVRRVPWDKLPEALGPLATEDQFIHRIPSLDFEEQKQFRLGAQAEEVIDYFARHFSGKAT